MTLSPPLQTTFANNDINFTDVTGIDHDVFGLALKKALYNPICTALDLTSMCATGLNSARPCKVTEKGRAAACRRCAAHDGASPNLIERALA